MNTAAPVTPYRSSSAWTETVQLPEPDQLARLLASPKPRHRVPYTPPLGHRWVQPTLFELVGAG